MKVKNQEPAPDVVTWVYEEGSYVPSAKLVNEQRYSIVSDYLGRPVQAYSDRGELVWQTDYDIYGGLRNLEGEREFIPFRQLGQYEDEETGLYYNRFRWYDSNTGNYISQDPIGLAGNNPTFYGYVKDANCWVDIYGLIELFRSMNRNEYFDILQNGWKAGGSTGGMESKWFAESFEDAVKWGQTMGHGIDSKFYVVSFEIDDAIADSAYKVAKLDGIGNAMAIDLDQLNSKSTTVISLNSVRVKCN